MTGAADNVDAGLRALADGNRRRILALVRDQPRAVGEIAEQVAMSQQAVSHHLRVLRGAGLVTEAHEGTRHLFQISTDGLSAVREFLDGFWPTHLIALKHAAEGHLPGMSGDPAHRDDGSRSPQNGRKDG